MGRINDIGELPQEKQFFTDYYNFRKEFYHGEGENDEWWERLVSRVDELERKYSTVYQRDLLLACVSDIERRARQANETAEEPT